MSDDSQASEAADAELSSGAKFRREAIEFGRFLLGAAAIFYLITTLLFRSFYIPSESMVPTLEVRDHLIVFNFPYGWSRHSLNFGVGGLLPEGEGRLFGRLPKRGHIVVFRSPTGREHIIKRVIGLPGDMIEVSDGRLYINQELVPREFRRVVYYRNRRGEIVNGASLYEETLPGGMTHAIYEVSDEARFDNFGPIVVPEGHIFVMGDNRDESADSRAALGPVPVEYLVGRAVTVLFTFHRCRPEPNLECPTGRILRGL